MLIKALQFCFKPENKNLGLVDASKHLTDTAKKLHAFLPSCGQKLISAPLKSVSSRNKIIKNLYNFTLEVNSIKMIN